MMGRLIRLGITLSIIATLLTSCFIENQTEIIAFCDHIVVNYVDDGYGQFGFILVETESGHEAGGTPVYVYPSSGPNAGSFTIGLDDDYPDGTTFNVYGYLSESDTPTFLGSDTCSKSGHHITHGTTWFEPGDSRLNRQAYAYAAVYCDDTNQRIGIYGIHSASTDGGEPGKGFPAIFVDYNQLPATPTLEQGNTLISQYANVSLYRLTSGEYQVNAGPDNEGKTYVVVFDGCPNTYMHAYMMQNGVMTPSEVYPR